MVEKREVMDSASDKRTNESSENNHDQNPEGKSLSITQEALSGSLRAFDPEDPVPEVHPMAVRRLEEFARATITQPVNVLANEYAKYIKNIVPYEWQCEAFLQNKRKNRYTDICCIDSTRVVLCDADGSARPSGDYIHANYVSSDELRSTYILAQAPTKETVLEFWHMVWQAQSRVIVMLCDYMENGKKKCIQYLPRSNTTVQIPSTTGRMTLRIIDAIKHSAGALIETHIMLAVDGREMKIKHWQWTGWGDFKVPSEFQTVFRVLRELRYTDRGFPIIHCSAGVGRSGTLVALELCLAVLRNGKSLNIRYCVEMVRRQRAHSVQNRSQYLFIYRALLELAAMNDLIRPDQINKFRYAYNRLVKKGLTIA
ncbi:protein-tyrosine phosphatase domain-containing protein [Ditylenchus destructor]|uniref:Protein-tyrosine phosphatase domain-containing protein n=1 Tax=Ditylenchus destructor TaxID=166010 RepID=A0AAD4N2N0_9BILA|nr:protein-tyrosine phosphatase domain-containing protein [Ditylenchus destructor]